MPELVELIHDMKHGEVRLFRRTNEPAAAQLEIKAHDELKYQHGRLSQHGAVFALERVYTMPRDWHIRFAVEADDWEQLERVPSVEYVVVERPKAQP